LNSLVGLLILFAIFSISSSKKKKKAQAAAQRNNASKRAQQILDQARQNEQSGKVPYTRNEWQTFLNNLETAAPAEQPSKPIQPTAPKPVQPKASKQAVPAAQAPLLNALQHDDPEGSISTQGETEAEHAGHHRKILEEESRLMEEHETLRELRRLNLQKLRSAVVMSEVLNKPVSLRSRGAR